MSAGLRLRLTTFTSNVGVRTMERWDSEFEAVANAHGLEQRARRAIGGVLDELVHRALAGTEPLDPVELARLALLGYPQGIRAELAPALTQLASDWLAASAS
jgi:hypothetical protein